MTISRRKIHYLRPGLWGLFENLMTYCCQAGTYVRDAYIRHYLTGARYDYTNNKDKVTCRSCLSMMREEGIIK